MGSLPGYIRAEGKPYLRDGQAVQDVRVRPWHPSMLATLWRVTQVQPWWFKPLVVVRVWLHLIRRAAHAG